MLTRSSSSGGPAAPWTRRLSQSLSPAPRAAGLALAAFALLGAVLASPAAAFDGRLLTSEGSPAAGFEVTVAGRALVARTDAGGRFRIVPDPAPPFTLIAIGPQATAGPPQDIVVSIPVAALPAAGAVLDLTLPASFTDTLTVVAGAAPHLDVPPGSATTVLSQEDLEQRRPPRLTDALDGVAGASKSDEGPTGVPILRGLGRGRTLVLLDGARVTTERRAGSAATFLDPFTLGSIEIARGPGSVAYGSDAFGGVIDARSRFPEPAAEPSLRFDVATSLGASDENSLGVEASHGLGSGALLGVFHAREAGEAEAGGGEPLNNSSYSDRGGALRYRGLAGGADLRLGLTVDRAYDVERPTIDSAALQTIYPLEESDRLTAGLAGAALWGLDEWSADLFLGRYRQVLDRDRLATPSANRRIESSDSDANDGSLRFSGTRGAGAGRLRFGAEAVSRFGLEALTEVEDFNAAGEPTRLARTVSIADASRTDLGLFASYDRAAGAKALLSVGLRGDRVETDNQGGFFGDRASTNEGLSGHAGVVAGPWAGWTATLQLARGFRDPLLSDRYFRGPSGRGFITGNPDLEPERSHQLDGSLRWQGSGRALALHAYRYRIENLIERFRPASDFFFRNRGEADLAGVELEAQASLPRGFSAELAAAWAQGESEDGAALDDIAAPGGWGTLRWAGERGFAWTRLAAFAEDDEPGPTELPRAGFTTWDLGAGWHLTKALELRGVARNLTDRRYFAVGDESADLARGRSFTLGIAGRI